MSSLRRALVGLEIVGLILGLLILAAIISSDHAGDRGLVATLTLLIGWAFIGTGLFAWDQRPVNRTGALMAAVGFTWLLQGLVYANPPGLFIAGAMLGTLPITFLIHMVVSFPVGRLEGRFARGVAGLAYFMGLFYIPIATLFVETSDPDFCQTNCPENPILVAGDGSIGEGLYAFANVVGTVTLVAILVYSVRRWQHADPDTRQRLGPALWAALATLGGFALLLASSLAGDSAFRDSLYIAALVAMTMVPFGLLFGLLRSRLSEAGEVAEENLRLDAELRARYEDLRASRTRIVEAADAARRKLERDLHDGAQQRLVGLALSLRLARERIDRDPGGAKEILDDSAAELATATDELRELARGIHPAILTDRGLGPALDTLAKRAPLDVTLRRSFAGRLPSGVEAAAYFVVAEALTNVVRHSGASAAKVSVARRNGALHVEVADGGRGGADAAGSGIRGLMDRVQALDGELELETSNGAGTAIHAVIPIDA